MLSSRLREKPGDGTDKSRGAVDRRLRLGRGHDGSRADAVIGRGLELVSGGKKARKLARDARFAPRQPRELAVHAALPLCSKMYASAA